MNGTPPSVALPELPVEVYRSHWRPACEERAFMLHAVGIESQVLTNGAQWSLFVAPAAVDAAVRHLRTYERENPPRRRVLRPEGTHPHAWVAPLAYGLVVLGVAWLAGHRAGAFDWFDAGVLDTAAFRAGEAWRAVTALTLHFDVAHLLGNLGFGALFGWLAAQLLGPGIAFGAGALAAVAANALNASFQPAGHVSAGASTAVFAMLGLLACYAWRRRADQGERWAYRWGPLIAGVCLLAFTGVGGERTDVLAHLTGFVVGGLAGFLLALRRRPAAAFGQWLAGLGTIALVVVAWIAALRAAG
ncbi:MAG TPA: rhomboid family intramembrane serine protease [Steroidobacteraceae bacterium]|nr:rhomboid family intramembrane serine protease [Steroidobacteraceae bacterium]